MGLDVGNTLKPSDQALPSRLKRLLDEPSTRSVKRSRTDRFDVESTLDPDADYDDNASRKAKPRAAVAKEKTKTVKSKATTTKSNAATKPATKPKAPAKQQSTVKSKTSARQTSTKSKASSKKQASTKRKASPEVSDDSTEDQIEVDPTSWNKEQERRGNASRMAPKVPEQQFQRSGFRPINVTTPKSPRIVDPSELSMLAQIGLTEMGDDDTQIPATPKELNEVQPRAPVAQMGRMSIQRRELDNSIETDHVLQVSTGVSEEAMAKQQSSESLQDEETPGKDIVDANDNIDPAITSEQVEIYTPQQTDDRPRGIPTRIAASTKTTLKKTPLKDTASRNATSRDPTPRIATPKTATPKDITPRVITSRNTTERNASMSNDTPRDEALPPNDDANSDIVTEQHQATEPSQVSSANQDASPQAGADVDQEEQAVESIVVNETSEPQQVENNRSKASTKTTEILQPPGPSMEMKIEYQHKHISEVNETAFYNLGAKWNDILGCRELLLEENTKPIELHMGAEQYWLQRCPLSSKGGRTVKILGRDAELAWSRSGKIVQNIMKYHEEIDEQPDLVQADLWHLIIPRVIRYISTIYAQGSAGYDDLGYFDTMINLLQTLSLLCNDTIDMRRSREGHSRIELVGLDPSLGDCLEQIIERLKGIKEEFDQERKLVRERIERQRREEVARLEERRRAIQQQEDEDRRREEELKLEREAEYRRERELYLQAQREAKYKAIKERSERYWLQELPSSGLVLSEIRSTADVDRRRSHIRKRMVSSSFVWTAALTDVLVDELRKYQDLDINRRYEQCLRCAQLKHLSLGEIRRRALEVKPWLIEQWMAIRGSVPRYVWTIE